MVIHSKFCIPQTKESTQLRPRLVHTPLKHLTIIHGPAGYGKSILALQILHEQEGTHLWFSVDKLDNNSNRFWKSFVSVFKNGFDCLHDDLFELLNSIEQYQTEEIMTVFLEYFMRVTTPVTLVIDDFHHITKPDIVRNFNFLIDYLQENIKLIVTSRIRPDLRLDARKIKGSAEEITAEHLAFTDSEINQLFFTTHHTSLPTEQSALIQKKTDGWISAIKLLFISTNDHNRLLNIQHLQKISSMQLYDYLLEEVFYSLADELVTFIQEAAIFKCFSCSMMDFIRGNNDSSYLISQLVKMNLFIQNVYGEFEWFRFHDLFKDFIEQFFRLSIERKQTLFNLGGQWLVTHHYLFEALDIFQKIENWQSYADIITQHGRTWLQEGQCATLDHYLSALPQALLMQNPTLICLMVWGMADTDKHLKGPSLLNAALEIQKNKNKDDFLLLCDIYTLKAIIERLNRNWVETLSCTNLALHYAQLGQVNMRWRSYVTLGAFEYIKGNLIEAKNHLYNAVKYAAIEKHRHGLAHSTGYLAAVLYQLGELQEAEHQVQFMITELEKTVFSKLKIGLLRLLCLPDFLREKGDFSSAEALLEQLNPIIHSEEIETLPKLFLFLAKWSLCLSQGHYQAAEKMLDKIESIELNLRFSTPFASGSISGMRARTQLMAGNIQHARNWLASAEKTLNPFLFMYHLDILTAIGVYYQNNDFEPAQALANKLLTQAQNQNWKIIEAKVLLLKSAILQAIGHAQEAQDLLSQSLDIGYSAGYKAIYSDNIKLLGENFYLESNDERYLTLLNEFGLFCPITASLATSQEAMKTDNVLSKREIQLLEYIKNGFGDKEISSQLYISTGTVKTHLRNIFRKLNAKNRAHALAIYSRPLKTN